MYENDGFNFLILAIFFGIQMLNNWNEVKKKTKLDVGLMSKESSKQLILISA